jgi:signal transduction protein with GAF and PtsI domain
MKAVLAALDYAIAEIEAILAQAEAIGSQVDAFVREKLDNLKALRERLTMTFGASPDAAAACPVYSTLSTARQEKAADLADVLRELCSTAE